MTSRRSDVNGKQTKALRRKALGAANGPMTSRGWRYAKRIFNASSQKGKYDALKEYRKPEVRNG